jgi:hypothetical protein
MSSLRNRLAASSGLAAPAILRATDREVEHVTRTRHFTTDAMMTFDQLTVDSTGAFLIGELERLDPTLHEPLVNVTWGRDIDLREDVTLADDTSSFTNSSFASPGGITPAGKNWISTDTNAITGVSIDIGKTANPLYLWGTELKYTLPELASAQKVGRPVDVQKYDAMKLKYQMDIDEQVYIGDTTYNKTGLFNNAGVDTSNVVNGAGGTAPWAAKTADEVLADVNAILTAAWTNSGTAVIPNELRVPPVQFGTLVSRKVSEAGNVSLLEFLRNNSLSNASNGQPLNIQPVKWLTGRGAGGTDRMVAYTRNREYVRFPLVPLQRTPLEFRSIYQITTYYGRLGVVEVVYPETLAYRDGI